MPKNRKKKEVKSSKLKVLSSGYKLGFGDFVVVPFYIMVFT
jgi:hypothetical protein